jgi:hypothetical protein
LTVVDPRECSDDVAAVPPSIPLDPEHMKRLSPDELTVLRRIIDKTRDAKPKAPTVEVKGDLLDTLEEELACHYGMRKDCPSCDD